ISADSPTQKVGAAVAPTESTDAPESSLRAIDGGIRHAIPMLSLENSYNREDVAKFVSKAADGKTTFTVEPKMDGAAVSITYEDGKLTLAATRGDGVMGEEITHNVLTIKALPHQIAHNGTLVVRGEIFMPKDVFEKLNDARAKLGQPLFANPRNAAAGSMKLLDSAEAARRGLDMRVYDVASSTNLPSHSANLEYCGSLGLPINDLNRVCHNLDEILAALDAIEQLRFSLPYEIDGAVIKVNEYTKRSAMGSTGKFPRWAVAYKYAALQATTILKSVTFQVGHTGEITPVAELEPVQLSGSTISRATLHNEDQIARLGVMIGDTVFIEKGGEIIPKIVKVVLDARPTTAQAITFPAECPICGMPLSKPDGEARWCCNNPECAGRVKATLAKFASREAMDIDGMGPALIDALVDEGRISKFADIYSLQAAELAKRDKMGSRSAQKLVAAIEKSKSQPFSRVLYAMSLPRVGVNTSKLLSSNFKNIDQLMAATRTDLVSIADIGDKTATILLQTFATEAFQDMVASLREIGLNMAAAEAPQAVESAITGKSFLITGTLSVPRKTMEDRIESLGGKLLSSVSKNLNYLIVGENAGSKLTKAESIGVPVLSEDDFEKMLAE
ncbi:MAG: NAD-dependent DNA ligase LigA, partial [Deferribacteraceae bacterium]|nr:NAD-dependent DNA ligase LigA [Deferribacteraceae bacterium]